MRGDKSHNSEKRKWNFCGRRARQVHQLDRTGEISFWAHVKSQRFATCASDELAKIAQLICPSGQSKSFIIVIPGRPPTGPRDARPDDRLSPESITTGGRGVARSSTHAAR